METSLTGALPDALHRRVCRAWNTFTKSFTFKKSVINTSLPQQNAQTVKFLNNNLSTRRYLITGSQRVSNYWWASVISLGGLAFLLTGFAAFLNTNLFLFNQSKNISFLPQGLIMCFYGSLGLLFGIYLWCTIVWGVGNGFNEFNKKQGIIRIFRWGLPGKNRRIDLVYKIEQVEAVRVELKEGINPRRTISLRLKAKGDLRKRFNKAVRSDSSTRLVKETPLSQGDSQAAVPPKKTLLSNSGLFDDTLQQPLKKDGTASNSDIPLTRIGQPIGLEDIESEASELARFLQVPLDSFYEM
uniref:photosystem I assembly protein Ycf4 n=1 Tax=Phyllosiphon coccidium TaxID=1837062 RepID=UPI00241178D6|nr:photosystem I assembly protein Ycf4 [Phyllosiphon coccidium]WDY12743.1 photosystem I assembly protein Ycf4 [Phyllosiphon coccidium]